MAKKKSETRNTASVPKQDPNTCQAGENAYLIWQYASSDFVMQSAFWSDKTTLKQHLNSEKEL